MTETATHRIKSRFQVQGSRFGARNIWCPHYGQCLDQCLADDLPGFTCQGCEHKHNHDAGPRDSQELAEDVIACRALFCVALGEVKRETAFKIQGITVRRGGLG